MGDSILQLQNVSKHFGGVVVLEDVSLEVAKGSRHALIGPNGAGKTTLFNLISGVFPLDSGTVLFEGRNLSNLPSRKRISLGMARSFQNIRLMPHL
ncbi:MAG: ATP-binding cassette domain-containing protein, partial [Rhizobiaceae bacterium]